MTTTKIKCACDWLGCKSMIVVSDDDMLYVYDDEEKAAFVLLPLPIAEAIRDAVKAMEDEH